MSLQTGFSPSCRVVSCRVVSCRVHISKKLFKYSQGYKENIIKQYENIFTSFCYTYAAMIIYKSNLLKLFKCSHRVQTSRQWVCGKHYFVEWSAWYLRLHARINKVVTTWYFSQECQESWYHIKGPHPLLRGEEQLKVIKMYQFFFQWGWKARGPNG